MKTEGLHKIIGYEKEGSKLCRELQRIGSI